jgi:uncharacterized membrane protein YkoI
MNTAIFRRKRVILPTVTLVAALGAGSVLWAGAANADVDVSGSDRDRVGNAAVQAVGGGTLLDVETSDDAGEAYEAEVRKADGTEVDVALDKDLKVVTQQPDTGNDADDNDADDNDADGADAGDRVLTAAERSSAEQAAQAAAGAGSTVLDVEASDDPGVAFEAEVRAADGAEWDVDLDAGFKVLNKTADN